MASPTPPDDAPKGSWAQTIANKSSSPIVDNTDLQNIWDESMKGVGGVGLPHRSCAVLLINWEEKLDDLHTGVEVDALERVFKDVYHYTVEKQQVKEGKRGPHRQVQTFLLEFINKYDDENTLLIIYYAGHGIPGKPEGQGADSKGLYLSG